jgi:hypothetical protein
MDNAWRSRFGVIRSDAEQSVDAANHAPDRAADHCANRTCNAAALVEAMSHAAGNALSLSRQRHRSGDDKDACNQCETFHARTPVSLEMIARRQKNAAFPRPSCGGAEFFRGRFVFPAPCRSFVTPQQWRSIIAAMRGGRQRIALGFVRVTIGA